MGIELTLTCNRLGAIELLEETGFRLGMLWQHMIVEVSHAQRLPRQRLSKNAAVSRHCPFRTGSEPRGNLPQSSTGLGIYLQIFS